MIDLKPGDLAEVAMTAEAPPRLWLRLGSPDGELVELRFSVRIWQKIITEVGSFLAERGLAAEMGKLKEADNA